MLDKLVAWRTNNINDKQFMLILSVLIGCLMGLISLVLKTLTKGISKIATLNFSADQFYNFLYIILPIIGIFLTVVVARYIIKKPIGHGIPSVLYAISRTKGDIKRHNTFSSLITSALTAGFGGSVGLEGPAVVSGGALGSQLSGFFKLTYKQTILMLGCAAAGILAAMFKAPIAAIIFAIEVIMLDLTMSSILPLLLASISATLVSYFLTGQNVLYSVKVVDQFELGDTLHYVALGIICGLASTHFTRMYMWLSKLFERIAKKRIRLILGAIILGMLVFLFPSLYGEGYEAINACLAGESKYLFENSIFYSMRTNIYITIGILAAVVILKVVATSITLGSGGVGGIFAPTLFTGAHLGFLYAFVVNMGLDKISLNNFALIGMAGLIAAVMHAPLTAIFLIADITSGYELLVPLMIVSAISYATIKLFHSNSVYTIQLMKRGEVMTHHKDHNILSMMTLDSLIETDFISLSRDDKLRTLVDAISQSDRNMFPVTGKEGKLNGIVYMNHIRQIMFEQEKYDEVAISELMDEVEASVDIHQHAIKDVVDMFYDTGLYNLPVIDKGKYVGFLSRSRVFSKYQQLTKQFSEH